MYVHDRLDSKSDRKSFASYAFIRIMPTGQPSLACSKILRSSSNPSAYSNCLSRRIGWMSWASPSSSICQYPGATSVQSAQPMHSGFLWAILMYFIFEDLVQASCLCYVATVLETGLIMKNLSFRRTRSVTLMAKMSPLLTCDTSPSSRRNSSS